VDEIEAALGRKVQEKCHHKVTVNVNARICTIA
jgi:hypothetical protein